MVDLHLHSRASDGTDAPAALLAKLQEAGIGIFAITDHDTIQGALEMRRLVPEGLAFIMGIEFSCKTDSGKCHILGFAYDPEDASFLKALELGKALRLEKLRRRLAFLRENFGISLTGEEREALEQMPSAGKPHLGNLLAQKGLARDKDDAIRRYINPCRTGNSKIDAKTAVEAIRAAGGIPVWAHPLGGEGDRPVPEAQFWEMLGDLAGYGLGGLECHYSRYTVSQAEWLAEAARRNGLWISGGSDYHGGNKDIPLGRLNAEGIRVPPEKLTILQAL